MAPSRGMYSVILGLGNACVLHYFMPLLFYDTVSKIRTMLTLFLLYFSVFVM